MSINRPAQRLARTALTMPTFTTSVRPRVLHLHLRPLVAHRTLFGWLRGNKKVPEVLDPMAKEFEKREQKQRTQQAPKLGDLAGESIFDDGKTKPTDASAAKPKKDAARDPSRMVAALDPRPEARRRWERKMVMRDIRKGARINKSTLIARNERQYTKKSHFFKTSLKKLMPLARQIAGKPVEDAIVQMRFSKKKAAADILRHLERARDEATVAAGMGLGAARRARAEAAGETVEPEQRMLVIDKKGVKRIVTDKTNMYVDQAWIGRGTSDWGLVRQAKGRRYKMDRPYTSITVQLKEEQTRIREQNERADKEASKKPWVQLPDRPVTRQTQYPLW